MKRMLLLILTLIFALPFVIVGCNDDDNPAGNKNNPPSIPGNPSPADGATDVPILTTLSWSCSDPDGDDLTYDVYLGTVSSLSTEELVESSLVATSYTADTLYANTTYYWKVVADDGNGGTTEGPVWSFTMEELPVGTEHEFELGNTGVYVMMVWVPAGTFEMGSPDTEQDRDPDEGPVHTVTISEGFWLGKYEVTQAQWEAVTGSNPSYFTGNDLPVESISHDDISNTFLPAINVTGTGNPWRLPTEAEWEYAARAGTTTRFYWGDDLSGTEIGSYAWYDGNNDPYGTKLVGQKTPNSWGLYDMIGNVWEKCSDWYGDYSSDSVTDPTGPLTGSYRVFRGGGWIYGAVDCRVASRGFTDPSTSGGPYFGFRLLRSEH